MLQKVLSNGRRALLLSALALVASARTASAEGLSWWCYNGSCCKMEGEAVTNVCEHDCILDDGQQLAPSILMGCPGDDS